MTTQTQINSGSSENLLSRKQAAALLGISIRNLIYKMKEGSLPYVQLGRLYKIIPSDLQRYIRDRRIGGTNNE